jgi:hypothetical protein
MRCSPVPITTHTVEMDQIADLNHRLQGKPLRVVTAAELGLEGSKLLGHASTRLPGRAVLVRLCWDGSPEFPYIHAHFSADSSLVVDMHTAALQALSHRLNLRQIWGVGSVPPRTPGEELSSLTSP